MSVTLSKGQRVDLNKDKQLNKVLVALGWDSNKYDGEADFDLDASVFVVKENGKVGTDRDFVFYGNLEHPSKCVMHAGDNMLMVCRKKYLYDVWKVMVKVD